MPTTELVIYTDGGARGNPGPSAIGVWVETGDGTTVESLSQYLGEGTNNEAEYEAFLASLEWLRNYTNLPTLTKIHWRLDSMLVVEQLNRRWKIKEPRIAAKAKRCWEGLSQLDIPYTISYVPRAQNAHADALVNQALDEQLKA